MRPIVLRSPLVSANEERERRRALIAQTGERLLTLVRGEFPKVISASAPEYRPILLGLVARGTGTAGRHPSSRRASPRGGPVDSHSLSIRPCNDPRLARRGPGGELPALEGRGCAGATQGSSPVAGGPRTRTVDATSPGAPRAHCCGGAPRPNRSAWPREGGRADIGNRGSSSPRHTPLSRGSTRLYSRSGSTRCIARPKG